MEKINLSEEQVFKYVKEGMTMIGYPENILLFSYIGDNDKPMFYATYEKYRNDNLEKHIKRLRIKDFVDLLKFSLIVNGYDIDIVDIKVRDEKICYSIFSNIVTYENGPRKNKRRR